jgi:hypothetical protein
MFVCGDLQYTEKNGWFMFANVVGEFGKKSHQYECVTKLAVVNQADVIKMQQYQQNGGLFASNKKEEVFYQMLLDAADDTGKIRTKNHHKVWLVLFRQIRQTGWHNVTYYLHWND